MTQITGVILAAGQSRRMGEDKLLKNLNGEPLLARIIREVTTSQLDEVITILSKQNLELKHELAAKTRVLINPNAHQGLGNSLAFAVQNLTPKTEAVMVILADLAMLESHHINTLIAAHNGGITRACGPNGQSGHPVIFDRRYFEELSQLSGDEGAKSLIRRHATAIQDVRFESEAPNFDLDTPEDWARFTS